MATYLIGDIQGCYGPLQRLLHKIRFDPAADRLWLCGDLVNRGGQSLEVLRLLYSLREHLVITLGNHDLYLLSDHVRWSDGNSPNREFRAVLQAHDRQAMMDWLQRRPLAFWSDEFNLLLVHAGVVPQWTAKQTLALAAEVEDVLASAAAGELLARVLKNRARRWKDQRSGMARLKLITSILTRIRFCDGSGKILWSASGPPGSQPKAYQPWFKHPRRQTRDVRIAFGHWAALGLRIKKRYIALDSGCVWGGRLSALRLEDEILYQVPGKYR
jgi:bis(5'-nucleosyl)-tetraphosphatase (symmetrical)